MTKNAILDVCMTPADAASVTAQREAAGWTFSRRIKELHAVEVFKQENGQSFDNTYNSNDGDIIVLAWHKDT